MFEIGEIQIQVFVIKLFEDLQQDPLQIEEVHDHTGSRIDLPSHRHFQHVVMTMPGIVITGAECGAVLRCVPLRLVVPVRGAELYAFIQEHRRHTIQFSMFEAQFSREIR